MKKLKKFKEVIKRIANGDLEVGGDYYRYEGPRVSSSQLGIATHISNYERKVRTTLYFVYGPHGRLEAVGLRAYRDPLIPKDIHRALSVKNLLRNGYTMVAMEDSSTVVI